MPSSSASPFPTLVPSRSSPPPPLLIPPITPCSRRSTPRSHRLPPPGRPPSRSTPPLLPSLLTLSWGRIWPCPLCACSAILLFLAAVALISVSVSPCGCPVPSLFLPPSLALLPPSSPGPLWTLAPPRAPLPPALATNITRKDKDVRYRTGGVVALWSVVGGSVPRRKSHSRPLAVLGGGISRPQFLQRPQQKHPVHCWPALRHSHALADGPVVEQVECRVQLQHLLNSSHTRLLVGRLTVEPIPNPSVGVSPFLFCPPNGPAAFD